MTFWAKGNCFNFVSLDHTKFMVERKLKRYARRNNPIIKKMESKAKSSLCSKSKKTNQTPWIWRNKGVDVHNYDKPYTRKWSYKVFQMNFINFLKVKRMKIKAMFKVLKSKGLGLPINITSNSLINPCNFYFTNFECTP